MDEVQRAWFAKEFNSLAEHVREWRELAPYQQLQASVIFSGQSMAFYVYIVDRAGNMLCRHKRARGYNRCRPVEM